MITISQQKLINFPNLNWGKDHIFTIILLELDFYMKLDFFHISPTKHMAQSMDQVKSVKTNFKKCEGVWCPLSLNGPV